MTANASPAVLAPVDVGARRAPVQGFSAGIPWSLHLEAWDAYAKKYGRSQTAERLAERGGFYTGELDTFLPGWRERVSEITALRAAVEQMAAELAAAREKSERIAVEWTRATMLHTCDMYELRQRAEAAEADAARYRWLRTNGKPAAEGLVMRSPENWDAAIDVAKRKELPHD